MNYLLSAIDGSFTSGWRLDAKVGPKLKKAWETSLPKTVETAICWDNFLFCPTGTKSGIACLDVPTGGINWHNEKLPKRVGYNFAAWMLPGLGLMAAHYAKSGSSLLPIDPKSGRPIGEAIPRRWVQGNDHGVYGFSSLNSPVLLTSCDAGELKESKGITVSKTGILHSCDEIICTGGIEQDGNLLVRIRAACGTVIWQNNSYVEPYVIGRDCDHLLIEPRIYESKSSNSGPIAALSIETGSVAWEVGGFQLASRWAILSDDQFMAAHIIDPDWKEWLIGIRTTTGREVWRRALPESDVPQAGSRVSAKWKSPANPIVTGELLWFVEREAGRQGLVALEVLTGQEIARVKVNKNARLLTAGPGRLFLRTGRRVVCLTGE